MFLGLKRGPEAMSCLFQSIKRPEAALADFGADLPGNPFLDPTRPAPANQARMGSEDPRQEIAGEQEHDQRREGGWDRADDRHLDAS